MNRVRFGWFGAIVVLQLCACDYSDRGNSNPQDYSINLNQVSVDSMLLDSLASEYYDLLIKGDYKSASMYSYEGAFDYILSQNTGQEQPFSSIEEYFSYLEAEVERKQIYKDVHRQLEGHHITAGGQFDSIRLYLINSAVKITGNSPNSSVQLHDSYSNNMIGIVSSNRNVKFFQYDIDMNEAILAQFIPKQLINEFLRSWQAEVKKHIIITYTSDVGYEDLYLLLTKFSSYYTKLSNTHFVKTSTSHEYENNCKSIIYQVSIPEFTLEEASYIEYVPCGEVHYITLDVPIYCKPIMDKIIASAVNDGFEEWEQGANNSLEFDREFSKGNYAINYSKIKEADGTYKLYIQFMNVRSK